MQLPTRVQLQGFEALSEDDKRLLRERLDSLQQQGAAPKQAPDTDFVVGYAKSSASMCRLCESNIEEVAPVLARCRGRGR